jgi:hypothetical protein
VQLPNLRSHFAIQEPDGDEQIIIALPDLANRQVMKIPITMLLAFTPTNFEGSSFSLREKVRMRVRGMNSDKDYPSTDKHFWFRGLSERNVPMRANACEKLSSARPKTCPDSIQR